MLNLLSELFLGAVGVLRLSWRRHKRLILISTTSLVGLIITFALLLSIQFSSLGDGWSWGIWTFWLMLGASPLFLLFARAFKFQRRNVGYVLVALLFTGSIAAWAPWKSVSTWLKERPKAKTTTEEVAALPSSTPELVVEVRKGSFSRVQVPTWHRIDWSLEEENVPLETRVNGSDVIPQPPTNDPSWRPLNIKRRLRTLEWRLPDEAPVEVAHISYQVRRL